ncbi:MAG: DUF393 domain-containing protein [Saprospiraceae bacterium]|nr:DUF393 domain-containing protein [Saprospiraceae bacterium]
MAIPEVINIREISEKHPVILFDGDCKFCNFWVQFVLKRDKKINFISQVCKVRLESHWYFHWIKKFRIPTQL